MVRNKAHHFRDLPPEVQELFGHDLPRGFVRYFAARFPSLLLETYRVIYRYCRDEPAFQPFFEPDL
jgi:serine/threonine-protein kinase/endoribonuclease IRE1